MWSQVQLENLGHRHNKLPKLSRSATTVFQLLSHNIINAVCVWSWIMNSSLMSCNRMSALVAPSGECLRGEGLAWLIVAVVCSLAAYRGSNCSLARAMDGRIYRCSIISSCLSTATSDDCKARLVRFFYIRIPGFSFFSFNSSTKGLNI